MGINEALDVEKYLRLPTVWGRSKREALAFLKEKIVQKRSGWKYLYLNPTGKEVLLKAIITTIPTYTMTLFHFPRPWCAELMSLMTHFGGAKEEVGRTEEWVSGI